MKQYPIVEPFCAGDEYHVIGDWEPVLYGGGIINAITSCPLHGILIIKKQNPISFFVEYFYKWKKGNRKERYWEAELFYSNSAN